MTKLIQDKTEARWHE